MKSLVKSLGLVALFAFALILSPFALASVGDLFYNSSEEYIGEAAREPINDFFNIDLPEEAQVTSFYHKPGVLFYRLDTKFTIPKSSFEPIANEIMSCLGSDVKDLILDGEGDGFQSGKTATKYYGFRRNENGWTVKYACGKPDYEYNFTVIENEGPMWTIHIDAYFD